MTLPGQRFELDLDADNFTFNTLDDPNPSRTTHPSVIKEIQEHDTTDLPAAPKIKDTKSGFPEHKARHNVSVFKQKQEQTRNHGTHIQHVSQVQPSDQAIRHRVAAKYGYDPVSQEKAEISAENTKRIAAMSEQDIEEAREELMHSLSPALLQRLLKRANIDEDQEHPSLPSQASQDQDEDGVAKTDQGDEAISLTAKKQPPSEDERLNVTSSEAVPKPAASQAPSIHFPLPPRNPSDYTPLDPSSSTFLSDLRNTYFPELSHTPNSLSWLQPLSPEEQSSSSYAPDLSAYPASSLRFDFTGNLIPPSASLSVPVSAGLHHHGDAPESAGYTIPELTLLARSTLPNQRCIAYQTIGRILFRLGRGDLGERGSQLPEALWAIVEDERVLELIMNEANREGGHVSAKAYGTEALWLWRKGGGGDRGIKKPNEQRAK